MIVGIAVAVSAIGVVMAPIHVPARLLVMCIGFVTVALSEWQLARYPMRSIVTLAAGFWCLTALNAIFLSGVHASANVVFPFVVALVGWALGTRWLVITTVVTMAFLVALASLEALGWFVPTARAPVIGVVTTLISLIPVMGYLTYAARKLLTESRNRAVALSEDLAQRNADLHIREQEFAQLLEHMPAAVASFDVRSRLRQCNRRYADLYGAKPEDLVGKHVREYAPAVVQDQVREAGRLALAGQPQTYRRFHVHPVTHEVTWLDAGVSPEVVEGKVVGLHTVLVDVTDKVQADAEIRNLNAELEQRVEKRTQELAQATDDLQSSHDELVRSQAKAGLSAMVASVSHELATPVGNSVLVASTFGDLAAALKNKLDANQIKKSSLRELQNTLAEGSDMLQRNLERAELLLKNFRQVSADQASEQCRSFDLAEVIAEVVSSMAPSLRKYSHRVVVEIPADVVMNSLPGPLGQVVINLINNAYLHAFEDRTDGILTIRCQAVGDDVLLQVEDNGKGMTVEVQQRLFEPFFSTRLGAGGTGLGMSIVQSIVAKSLGGSMLVHSVIGQGTRFDITLPRAAPRYRE